MGLAIQNLVEAEAGLQAGFEIPALQRIQAGRVTCEVRAGRRNAVATAVIDLVAFLERLRPAVK